MLFRINEHTPWWMISQLSCNNSQCRDGFEFGVILSPQLVQAAMNSAINKPENKANFSKMIVEEILQKQAGYTNLSKTWPVFRYHELFGVQSIHHPAGDGRWLSIQYEIGSERRGAKGYSHNIDNSAQQSVLIAIWAKYVQYLDLKV